MFLCSLFERFSLRDNHIITFLTIKKKENKMYFIATVLRYKQKKKVWLLNFSKHLSPIICKFCFTKTYIFHKLLSHLTAEVDFFQFLILFWLRGSLKSPLPSLRFASFVFFIKRSLERPHSLHSTLSRMFQNLIGFQTDL